MLKTENMVLDDPESFRDSKKVVMENGAKNLSIYSILGSIINAFSSSLRPFDTKKTFVY